MQAWAAEELRTASLPDKRLDQRLVRLVDQLSAQPHATVPQACGDWKGAKAAYRFWSNPRVTPQGILAPHVQATAQRLLGHDVVLAVQDTSEANYTSHPRAAGLGYLDHPDCRGLKFHSVLAVSTAGVPLGLLGQQAWARDLEGLGKRGQRQRKATQDKESQRWLAGLRAAEQAAPAGVEVVTIGDREADMYDLFAQPRRPGSHLLVRACQVSRRVRHPQGSLGAAVAAAPARGTLQVDVPRGAQGEARKATLTIRYLGVEVEPPQQPRGRKGLLPVGVQVVLAQEEHPPPGAEAIRWLLLTTLPVDSLEDARRCVRWYSYRWRVERFHYVLKSGCRLEQLELGTARRLQNALATYSIVAWRLLWLTYAARERPGASCEEALQADEWQALYARVNGTTQLPRTPPTLREAVRMLARLGGFLGRKGDGEPGVKTLWRGLMRLPDVVATWRLFRTHKPDPHCDST